MSQLDPQELTERAARVRLVALDVDGVLTDGGLWLSDQGGEAKRFHTRDGQGLKMLQHGGVDLAVISGRPSAAVAERMAQLGIEHVHLDCGDKLTAIDEILDALNIKLDAVAYVGDDLPDLAVIERVGLGIAVADAAPVVRAAAAHVTRMCGGQGAVREIAELILEAQGSLEQQISAYRG